MAQFSGFSLSEVDAPAPNDTITLEATPAPLWSQDARLIAKRVSAPDFSGTVTLDWSGLGEGDVAGLAVHQDATRWLSIQVERIEPADLIAVRLHDGPGGVTAGRLVFTTALGGSFDRKVRLRIDGEDGRARLLFAQRHGLWQILAEDVPLPVSAGARPDLVLFATDGADPAPPRK
ncbi:hypothetical protein D2V17_17735 [Aurantiacibacter xanthus]|uniref:Beta-xylosidase C-terminal Concanavalin A-like domain-containing protein n=1 Tax=Aurantiacibacter xanthus TaxID=1784712 RepID=A0A3A1NZ88_9SPHN|nr:hypothetical protein D2V17_17735 [Aurantiacibacter xanthus]